MSPTIEDHDFLGADKGILLSARNVSDGSYRLSISNLDRTDPPQYTPNGFPRSQTFNGNVLALADDPTMPSITVQCDVTGFTPSATTPIYWRLQVLDVMARYFNRGRARYASKVVSLRDEWTGRSEANQFSLFDKTNTPATLVYDNGSDRVAGGHAVLTVAARPDSTRPWLIDFVHLRIKGANPVNAKIRREVASIVAGRGAAPFEAMLNAIFAWEASGRQFSGDRQTQTHYDGVLFDWPDDPADFPVAAFDFGVGLSQFTDPGNLVTGIAWDWRLNLAAGANVFFNKLNATYSSGITWSDWALAAWQAYNGSGPKAVAYAQRLANSPDGRTIPTRAVPKGFNLGKAIAEIAFPTPPPGQWPLNKAATTQITAAALASAKTDTAAETIATAAAQVAGNQANLVWMWPQVVNNLHAQKSKSATNVLPGLNAVDVSSSVAGLDAAGVDHLANKAFGLAWNSLATPAIVGAAPAAAMSIDQEFFTLDPFVRAHIGEHGTVNEWSAVRTLMLTAFGAPGKPALAIERINAYYTAFVAGSLGGATMRVQAAMKAKMDATSALLATQGARGQLAKVADIGGFDIRRNANNSSALSNHSFGIAIDLDAALNPNMSMKDDDLTAWVGLVTFLTGIDPYGAESRRLRTLRPYAQALPDIQILRKASADYVNAHSSSANLAAAVAAGLNRQIGIMPSLADVTKLLALAAPPHPDREGLEARLTQVGIPASKRAATAARLIFAQETFALAQSKTLKPSITGTAATTAKYGFINLPSEVIAGLVASNGGALRWLGTANGTKDYMHFDFPDGQHPPLY